MTKKSNNQPRTPRENKAQAGTPSGAVPPAAPDGKTCKEAHEETYTMFAIGDVVRLKSERRWMTVTGMNCVDVYCRWFNGDTLEEDEFHRLTVTKETVDYEVPF
jgi:uncharacterized protein YodC (DUF2158 family)